MKKKISVILFILSICIFVYDVYFTIVGTLDVKASLDLVSASGGGRIDYLGVGLDILIIFVALFTVISLALSIASSVVAQSHVIRIASIIISILLIPTVSVSFLVFIN